MCPPSFVYLKRINIDYSHTDQSLLEIAETVESFLGVKKNSIANAGRVKEVAEARMIFCLLASKFTKLSLKAIGGFINRYHSTVIYNRNTANDLLEVDKSFSKKYYKCLSGLKRISISYE